MATKRHKIRGAIMIAGVSVVTGCTKPTFPYTGLDTNSYGPLLDYQDKDSGESITPPPCDPDNKYSDVDELSRRIAGAIMRPVSGLDKVDPSIMQYGLQSKFRIPGDPGGYTVTILRASKAEIVFWYDADLVTLPEVSAAAKTYCEHQREQVVYRGSAKKCGDPQRLPVAVNGKSTAIPTYVISSFQCSGSFDATVGSDEASAGHRTLIKEIQIELRRHGLLRGTADGSYGPKTKAAIENFQRHKGIPVDGIPTATLLEQLQGK